MNEIAVQSADGLSSQSAKFFDEEIGIIISELEKSGLMDAPPKLYKIGEVIEHSGLSRQTIHNYTTMGLIRENRWTQAGHRLYNSEVFRRLAIINKLKSQYSLSKIKRVFEFMELAENNAT